MTEKHYVFLQNPIRLNLYKFVTQYMLGKAGVAGGQAELDPGGAWKTFQLLVELV